MCVACNLGIFSIFFFIFLLLYPAVEATKVWPTDDCNPTSTSDSVVVVAADDDDRKLEMQMNV